MNKRPLPLAAVRRLAVHKQGLRVRPPVANRAELRRMITRIGLVQVDAVQTVDRSHHLVLLSRVGPYDRRDMQALQQPPRRVAEQWAHAASILPVEHYRWWLPLFAARCTDPLGYGHRKALGLNPEQLLAELRTRVRDGGPLSARDFESQAGHHGWWHRKTGRAALDLLHYRGELGMVRDANFICSYDLAEHVIPRLDVMQPPSIGESIRWMTQRGLESQGVATAESVADYYRLPIRATRAALAELVHEGAVLSVGVEGWSRPAFLSHDDLSSLERIHQERYQPRLTTFLSPFDSLIWDRRRVLDLFQFSFRNCMYMPAAARQADRAGYYVMPILHGDRLVGRIDPKVDRLNRRLVVRWIELEESEVESELVGGLRAAIRELADFTGCEQVRVTASRPNALRWNLVDRPKAVPGED